RCSRDWLAISAPALHPAKTAPPSRASSSASHSGVPWIVAARGWGLPPEKKTIEIPCSARACSSISASSRVFTGTSRASIPAVAECSSAIPPPPPTRPLPRWSSPSGAQRRDRSGRRGRQPRSRPTTARTRRSPSTGTFVRSERSAPSGEGTYDGPKEVTRMDQASEEHIEQGILKTIEAAGDVTVERALVGVVNGRDVTITQAGAGPIAAQGDVTIQQGGCGPVLVGRDLTIRQGGCGPAMVRGSLSIQQGGTQSALVAGPATIGSGAFVGLVASPKVTVEEGARVLVGTPGAFAVGAAARGPAGGGAG